MNRDKFKQKATDIMSQVFGTSDTAEDAAELVTRYDYDEEEFDSFSDNEKTRLGIINTALNFTEVDYGDDFNELF